MEKVKVEKLQELINDIKTGMMVTANEEDDLRSRPMSTQKVDDKGNIWFFTSGESGKIAEIFEHRAINLAYSKPSDNTYLSVSGVAALVTEEDKIKELYTPTLKAWFPEGIDDPSLVLIKVVPYEAEYWDDTSSKLVNLFKIAKAIAKGEIYDGGSHAKM
jgi:general stress protein 26